MKRSYCSLTFARRSSHNSLARCTSRGSGPLRFKHCQQIATVLFLSSASNSRDMQIHRFITFTISPMFCKSRTSTFDLYTTSGFLLDVLYICTTMTNNLSPKVEASDWFEIDGYTFLWPFALYGRINQLRSMSQTKIPTRPNSSLSTCSGSRLRNRLSSTRFGSSCCISSSILATAFSRPSFVVLVT